MIYHSEQNQKDYEVVDAKEFAKELESQEAHQVIAEKSGYVLARDAIEGQQLPVYTQNGNLEAPEVEQKENIVLTRCDEKGEPVVDEHGHTNSWQVSKEIFEKKYDVENQREDGFTKPAGGMQHFIQTDRDIAISVPWGENGQDIYQTVDKGGYLNITDRDDIYGIAQAEFHETYKDLAEKNIEHEIYPEQKEPEHQISDDPRFG